MEEMGNAGNVLFLHFQFFSAKLLISFLPSHPILFCQAMLTRRIINFAIHSNFSYSCLGKETPLPKVKMIVRALAYWQS